MWLLFYWRVIVNGMVAQHHCNDPAKFENFCAVGVNVLCAMGTEGLK